MDYISRAALVGKLTSSDTQQKIKAMSGADAYNEFLTLLNAEPQADVAEVRRGEWLHNENYVLWAERYICSLCGRNAPSDGDYRHELTDYCPHCGARMDGGADNGE